MGDTSKFDEIFIRLLGLGIQTQAHLASVLNISPSTVWHLKNRNRFPGKWVSKLCQIYDVTPEFLLGSEPKVSNLDLSMLITEDRKNISALETANHFLSQRVKVLEQEMAKPGSGIKREPLKIVSKKGTPPLSE